MTHLHKSHSANVTTNNYQQKTRDKCHERRFIIKIVDKLKIRLILLR